MVDTSITWPMWRNALLDPFSGNLRRDGFAGLSDRDLGLNAVVAALAISGKWQRGTSTDILVSTLLMTVQVAADVVLAAGAEGLRLSLSHPTEDGGRADWAITIARRSDAVDDGGIPSLDQILAALPPAKQTAMSPRQKLGKFIQNHPLNPMLYWSNWRFARAQWAAVETFQALRGMGFEDIADVIRPLVERLDRGSDDQVLSRRWALCFAVGLLVGGRLVDDVHAANGRFSFRGLYRGDVELGDWTISFAMQPSSVIPEVRRRQARTSQDQGHDKSIMSGLELSYDVTADGIVCTGATVTMVDA